MNLKQQIVRMTPHAPGLDRNVSTYSHGGESASTVSTADARDRSCDARQPRSEEEPKGTMNDIAVCRCRAARAIRVKGEYRDCGSAAATAAGDETAPKT
jgi:hypothetical protein